MRKYKYLISFLALSLILVACSKGGQNVESQDSEGKIKVLTSFFVLEDFARQIGGDKVEVKAFIPNGQAPHGWEPSPQDMAKLQDTDLFIYSGGGFEPWAEDIIGQVDKEKTLVVEASEGASFIAGHSHDHDHEGEATEAHEGHDHEAEATEAHEGHDHEAEATEAHEGHDHEEEATESHEGHDHEGEATESHEGHDHEAEATEAHEGHDHEGETGLDPHIWTSPKQAIIMAENIYKGLAEKDPANQAYYQENFRALEEELIKLDSQFSETLSKAKSRDIVVSHEAYGYMAKEYNLNQVPIEGINSQMEPDPKTMQEIVDYVKANKVGTIFSEPLIDPKVAETIAKETGAQVAILDPLEGLTGEKTLEDTSYVQLMEENLKALEKALVE